MAFQGPAEAWVRPLRLGCGLILIAYLVTHFSNHALGLVSLRAMEAARFWFLAFWRNPLAESVLLLALLAHWLLGLWIIYRRRTWRMPAWEATQIVLGLCVPPLLAYHVVGTRLAGLRLGVDDPYARVVLNLLQDPWAALRQTALLAIAWTHGCMGLHFWLRFRRWYGRVFPVALIACVLLPLAALLGAAEAGREVSALAQDPAFTKQLFARTHGPFASQRVTLGRMREALLVTIWALLFAMVLARILRERHSWRRSLLNVRYLDGREVRVPLGWSVLEASRSAGIPHASVCGGRARCSTCRIRVAGDPLLQPAPAPLEQRLLERIHAPPNVRLACQLRPRGDLTVAPLLQAAISAAAVPGPSAARAGEEREVAVLFADLRGFTRIAERKLPYDVVFILNRYFEAVGGAVSQAGGIANQYTGDGVMALFGIEAGIEAACRQALLAASAMVERVEALDRALRGDVEIPLRIGIGVHAGPVVVGEMGYGGTRYLTAVGDTVNTASRLEAATKQFGCQLVVSERVIAYAGVPAADFPREELALRNREAPLRVVIVDQARRLAESVRAAKRAEAPPAQPPTRSTTTATP